VTTDPHIRDALQAVIDPELHRSIVELDMVRSIDISANGVVDVTVSLTTPGCPIKGHFQTAVAQAVSALDGVTHVNVYFDVLDDAQKTALQHKLGRGSLPEGALAQVANVLCIGSGKGGVGKSTLTANLAAALAGEGKRVGVLDADVWGYSIPRMYGLGATRPAVSAERKIIPATAFGGGAPAFSGGAQAHGIKVMSIGFFVGEDDAVVWRGPMLHKALTQFLQDVDWGALDYLLVDLPPGTGDVSMTLAQLLPQAQFVIVTTPQATAQKVARRSAQMAHKVSLEIGGVIENMSGFTTPSGERFAIFGQGGGQELADELDVPMLGSVPITMPLREHADSGTPLVIADPDDPAAQAIRQVARGLIAIAPAAPMQLPVLPVVQVGAPTGATEAPAAAPAEPKPVGMSLPMA
jgi:ATP-binding protein involved in chromosome partitioning